MMKRMLLLTVAAAILFCLPAMAQPVTVFMWDPDGQAWVIADPDCDAMMTHQGTWSPRGVFDKQFGPAIPCSKFYWVFCPQCGMGWCDTLVITTTAQVNQWFQAYFEGNDVDWTIQHPGLYTGNSFSLKIASNDHVGMFTTGLGPLQYQGTPQVPGTEEIPVWWGMETVEGQIPSLWCSTDGEMDMLIDMTNAALPTHELLMKLWQKIEVVKCNPVGTYENEVTVTFMSKVDWED